MITALRFQPSDFEYAHGWLNHVPSRHRFQFDRSGRVTIDALCGCAALSVRPEQADELHATFKTWRHCYWQPTETNREFASHFRAPNRVGQIVPRHPDGLAAFPASGRTDDGSRRRPVGDARGIGGRSAPDLPRRRVRRVWAHSVEILGGADRRAGEAVPRATLRLRGPRRARGPRRFGQTIPEDEPATAGRSFAFALR